MQGNPHNVIEAQLNLLAASQQMGMLPNQNENLIAKAQQIVMAEQNVSAPPTIVKKVTKKKVKNNVRASSKQKLSSANSLAK